jgi:glycerophosphoryl diester phosphodiesterase
VAEPGTLRLAHRGDWRAAPENSLAAIEAALAVPGCDGLEFDIRCSSDGVPVLLHDETLARVQRIPAACATLTAAELAEHGIPTLGQVLKAIGCDPFLDVELKEPVQGAIDVLELERGRIDDDGRPTLRSAVVSSFDDRILRWVADQRPTWPRWLNANDLSTTTIDRALELGCEAISVEWHGVDADAVTRARDAGLGFAAWTVRDEATYRRIEVLGPMAIIAEATALEGGQPG